MARTRYEPKYASIVAKPSPKESYNTTFANAPTPMEIDETCRHRPLLEEEKQRRRANCLCLNCGGRLHVAINCPHRPRRQVNEVSTITKVEAIPCGVSNNLGVPRLSNKFEVLSQLHDELNN